MCYSTYYCTSFIRYTGRCFVISYYPNKDFDTGSWLADREKRYEFSDDIIRHKLLLGKTKAEVQSLLGKADETSDYESDDWGYYLGYKPAIGGTDYEVLDVQFKDGKVVEVGQHQT